MATIESSLEKVQAEFAAKLKALQDDRDKRVQELVGTAKSKFIEALKSASETFKTIPPDHKQDVLHDKAVTKLLRELRFRGWSVPGKLRAGYRMIVSWSIFKLSALRGT